MDQAFQASSAVPRFDHAWSRRWQLKWQSLADDLIPLDVGEMDFLPPDAIRATIMEYVCFDPSPYPPARGLLDARQQIATFQSECHGYSVDERNVTLAVGVRHVLSAIFDFLLKPGCSVVFAGGPAYLPVMRCLQSLGVEVRIVPLLESAGWSLDLAGLMASVDQSTKAVLIISPHNPTGKVFTEVELRAVLRAAQSVGAWIISDEVYEHLILYGHHQSMLALAASAYDRALVISSYAKPFNTGGYRGAFILHTSDEATAMLENCENINTLHNTLSQVAMIGCIRAGVPWLDAVKTLLRKNLKRVERALGEIPLVSCIQPQAGFTVWLRLETLLDAGTVADRLETEQMIRVWSNKHFAAVDGNFLRINFATSPELLDVALKRLKTGLMRIL